VGQLFLQEVEKRKKVEEVVEVEGFASSQFCGTVGS